MMMMTARQVALALGVVWATCGVCCDGLTLRRSAAPIRSTVPVRGVVARLRGGATTTAPTPTDATAPIAVKDKSRTKSASRVLDGGLSQPSLHDQLTTAVDRLVRLLRRLYDRFFLSVVDATSTTTQTTQTTTTPRADAEPSPPLERRRAAPHETKKKKGPTTTASRKAARIARELAEFRAHPPEGCKLTLGKNLNVWIVTLTGAPNTIFAGEKYRLRVAFPADYPTAPPSVYFLSPPPRHPHVYTNGDICLNLLGRDWRPNLSVAHLSLSILSMLSSAKTKGIPQDNAIHANSAPGKTQEGWMYHDDSC